MFKKRRLAFLKLTSATAFSGPLLYGNLWWSVMVSVQFSWGVRAGNARRRMICAMITMYVGRKSADMIRRFVRTSQCVLHRQTRGTGEGDGLRARAFCTDRRESKDKNREHRCRKFAGLNRRSDPASRNESEQLMNQLVSKNKERRFTNI